MRQSVSFAPRRLLAWFTRPRLLTALCIFTAACGLWLGSCNIRLHHPKDQLLISAMITGQAFLTLVAMRFRQSALLRLFAMLGCLAISGLACRALDGVVRGYNFEGYILFIALLLVFQALFTVGTLAGSGRGTIRPGK